MTDSPATWVRAAPEMAFERAMLGVDTRCSHVTALLDRGDLEHLDLVARSAFYLWLEARRAYLRLVRLREVDPAEVQATRERLDAMCLQLHEVIKRACVMFAKHPRRKELAEMRKQLAAASEELGQATGTHA